MLKDLAPTIIGSSVFTLSAVIYPEALVLVACLFGFVLAIGLCAAASGSIR